MAKSLKVHSSEIDQEKLTHPVDGVLIGKFAGLNDTGAALVDFPNNPAEHVLPALTTTPLSEDAIGRDVALMFEQGDLFKPIVIGLIQSPEKALHEVVSASPIKKREPAHAEVDGERVTFTAEKEIVLRCGKASITLTKAGKILIRGTYLLSRSSGVNRIKGGSIQLN